MSQVPSPKTENKATTPLPRPAVHKKVRKIRKIRKIKKTNFKGNQMISSSVSFP